MKVSTSDRAVARGRCTRVKHQPGRLSAGRAQHFMLRISSRSTAGENVACSAIELDNLASNRSMISKTKLILGEPIRQKIPGGSTGFGEQALALRGAGLEELSQLLLDEREVFNEVRQLQPVRSVGIREDVRGWVTITWLRILQPAQLRNLRFERNAFASLMWSFSTDPSARRTSSTRSGSGISGSGVADAVRGVLPSSSESSNAMGESTLLPRILSVKPVWPRPVLLCAPRERAIGARAMRLRANRGCEARRSQRQSRSVNEPPGHL